MYVSKVSDTGHFEKSIVAVFDKKPRILPRIYSWNSPRSGNGKNMQNKYVLGPVSEASAFYLVAYILKKKKNHILAHWVKLRVIFSSFVPFSVSITIVQGKHLNRFCPVCDQNHSKGLEWRKIVFQSVEKLWSFAQHYTILLCSRVSSVYDFQ